MPVEHLRHGPTLWDERRMGPRPLLRPTMPWLELAAVWTCAVVSLYIVAG